MPEEPPTTKAQNPRENIDQLVYVLLPAINNPVSIISYTVPTGCNAIIQKLGLGFRGGGWVDGSGDIKWRVLVDGAPPSGVNSYGSIVARLGSTAQPNRLAVPLRLREGQTLAVVAFNDPYGPHGGVVVAGQRLGARVCGYLLQVRAGQQSPCSAKAGIPTRGQICVQVKDEMKRVRYMAREGGQSIKEIRASTPDFKIWEFAESENLPKDDRETLLRPNQWAAGYANLLLSKYFGVSKVTIRDYITAYNKANPKG